MSLISVIIPIYNDEEYLNQCLNSVIYQSHKDLEIILIDDGSTDRSGAIADKYAKKDDRIQVIHQRNKGASSARNYGLKKAKGEWISFVDADDYLEKEFFKTLLTKAKEKKAQIAISGYYRVVGTRTEAINSFNKDVVYDKNEYLIGALNPQMGIGFCHMKIYKKDAIKDIRFDENLIVGEDALFNEMVAENIERAVFIGRPLYNFRVNPHSIVRTPDEKYIDRYINSVNTTKDYIFMNYDSKNIIQNYYNYVAYIVMVACVNSGKKVSEVCNVKDFEDGIKKSNFKGISKSRKIALFTIKHKLYLITEMICKIRRKQNS